MVKRQTLLILKSIGKIFIKISLKLHLNKNFMYDFTIKVSGSFLQNYTERKQLNQNLTYFWSYM